MQTAAGATPTASNGPPVQVTPKRVDQFPCPMCRHYGCPSKNGTRPTEGGRLFYRSCSRCEWTFVTVVWFATGVEELRQ